MFSEETIFDSVEKEAKYYARIALLKHGKEYAERGTPFLTDKVLPGSYISDLEAYGSNIAHLVLKNHKQQFSEYFLGQEMPEYIQDQIFDLALQTFKNNYLLRSEHDLMSA